MEVRLWYRLAVQEILQNIESQGFGKVEAIIPPLLMEETSLTGHPAARIARKEGTQ